MFTRRTIPRDLLVIQPQAAQAGEARAVEYGLTVVDDGHPVAVVCMEPIAEGCVAFSALIETVAPHKWPLLFRKFKDIVESTPATRLEAIVRADFRQGQRMLEMLGFKREGYHPSRLNGADVVSYGRIAP